MFMSVYDKCTESLLFCEDSNTPKYHFDFIWYDLLDLTTVRKKTSPFMADYNIMK